MSQDLVLVAIDGPVATVTMNRPEAMNALSGGLRIALAAAMRKLEADPAVRVVILTGAGSVFAPHGTSVETRLTVIDKVPADDPVQFAASPGEAPDLATLLRWLTDNLPPRQPIAAAAIQPLSVPAGMSI